MNDDRPIIIIKKKGAHAGHHGGAWKVAYADFVTAMMALFLVLWILGLNQDVRKSIAAYFNDPTGMMKSHAGGTSVIGVNRSSDNGKPSIVPTRPRNSAAIDDKSRFEMMKQKLEQDIARSSEFKRLSKNIEIHITPEGLRIELLENAQSLFFKSGSAVLKPETVHLLHMIAGEVRKLPNNIILEGYTDAHPYSGGVLGYSNWELSTDRANSARRAMEPILRSHQVLEVRGYADRHLRDPAHPYLYSNRRITILVTHTDQWVVPPAINVGPNSPGLDITPVPDDITKDRADFSNPNR
jgi:chemotaxis protein MotB